MTNNNYQNPSVEFLKEVKNSTDVEWKVSTIRKIFDNNTDDFFIDNKELITTELGDFITEHKELILNADTDENSDVSTDTTVQNNNSENN